MKIERYPGKAVDASLSLDRNSAMVELYEANWYQAQQNFAQHRGTASKATAHKLAASYNGTDRPNKMPATAPLSMRNTVSRNGGGGSYLKEGVSTLNKYQMTLDQIRALERESADGNIVNTIKSLNGYKTATSVQKPSFKSSDNWNGWVDPDEESQVHDDFNTVKRQQRPRQQVSIKPPSLKRSQTMVYTTPRPPKPHANNLWFNRAQAKRISTENNDFSTVISQQPQPLREKLLSSTDLIPEATTPLPTNTSNDCDSSLGTLDKSHSASTHFLPPTISPPPIPVPKPRTTAMSVSRSKSVRFPAVGMYQSHENLNNHTVNASATPTIPSKPVTYLRNRKISLDIKQGLENLNTNELLSQQFDDLRVGNNTTGGATSQHSRQASGSSTSSAHSSNTSSSSGRNSQKHHDQFAIPRPRLIVPIHTYARKRRTGNLIDQDIETINQTKDNDDADDVSVGGGKICLSMYLSDNV